SILSDIMELGSPSRLQRETVSLGDLIAGALKDVFAVRERASVSFRYDLKHSHLLRVAPSRVMRLFGNIVSNAVQAMPADGLMWFDSHEIRWKGKRFIEISIGNS